MSEFLEARINSGGNSRTHLDVVERGDPASAGCLRSILLVGVGHAVYYEYWGGR